MTLPLATQVTLGAHAAGPTHPDPRAHQALEQALGVRLPVMSWFLPVGGRWPVQAAATAAATGHDLLICLEPITPAGRPIPFADVLAGAWDEYLLATFRAARDFPGQVTIRFAHEMNLRGQPSCVDTGACTRSIGEWLHTWRYVVDLQRSTPEPVPTEGDGAPTGGSLRWMWCVHAEDTGTAPAEAYWPGPEWADVLGIDAYNGFGPWIGAHELIAPMYERVAALHPQAPIWLAEAGCRAVAAGEPHDKGRWWLDLMAIQDLPRLTGLCFFEENKERDWRVSTPDTRAQLAQALRPGRTPR
jgi:mannan endo-1,4-beta-mannosidase